MTDANSKGRGPYRESAAPPAELPLVRVRPAWWLALWQWWRYRRCVKGDHAEVFEVAGFGGPVRLECERCGLVRDLVGYGPLAFRATGWWRTP